MPKNAPNTSDLSVSVRRRLTHLEPVLQFLWAIHAEEVAEKTKLQYQRADERMRLRGLLPEQIGANSRRSYNLYRAALVYSSIMRIAELYAVLVSDGDSMSSKRGHHCVNLIEVELMLLADYPPRASGHECKWRPPSGGAVRKSKRRKLGSLPTDWRLRMLRACPVSSKYRTPLAVATLTGLRPAELAMGVRVAMAGTNDIAITVRGAKVTELAGQPVRKLWLALDNPIARYLAQLVKEAGGGDSLVVSISSPGAFTSFVRRLSRRVYKRRKYVISPYSYRHAFAADLKSERVAPDELAAMLGHVTVKSQRGYGSASQGKPIGRVSGCAATRIVRTTPVSRAAAAWVACKPSLANGCRYSPSLVQPAMQMLDPVARYTQP